MARLTAKLERRRIGAVFEPYYRNAIQRLETAALIATDRGATQGKTRIREAMQGAGLGRLGGAIDATSDLKRGAGVHRRGASGFSASGTVFIRSKSERTRGAIEAYTEGAEIMPKRGRWLWIPTDAVARLVGSRSNRRRMTPAEYVKAGNEAKIGPLVLLRSVNGYPLLAVENVGVSETGQKPRVRGLTKSGRPRKGDRLKRLAVLFVGIPYTSRAARVDAAAILRQVRAELPMLAQQALGAR